MVNTSDITTIKIEMWKERYDSLSQKQVTTNEEFRAWLLTWAALEEEIYERHTDLLREFQSDTRDQNIKTARQNFLIQDAPLLKQRHDAMAALALVWARTFEVPADWRQAFLYFRIMGEQASSLGHELEGHLEAMGGEITRLFAHRTYELESTLVNAQEIAKRMASSNRETREAALHSSRASLLQIAPQVVDLYGSSLNTRRELARRSGHVSVHAHQWQLLERFDYSPEDVRQFRADVRAYLSPLLLEFREQRRQLLGVDHLQAWDLACDPFGAPAIPRFTSEAAVVLEAARQLRTTRTDLEIQVKQLYTDGFLDLTARPGKAARSYTDFLAAQRRPYMQMALQPTPSSYQVMFHELGHVAQLTGVAPESSFWQFFPGVEMREFVAQVYELWSLDVMPAFFSFEHLDRYRARFYEQTLSRISAQCLMDEFQEWFYTADEQPSAERLSEMWVAISAQYPTGVERGNSPTLGYLSQQLVRRPLVGIEYAMAWGWAFSFVENVKADAQQAFGQLAEALRLGNTRPLPDLLEVAGVKFSFSAAKLQQLSGTLRQGLVSI